MKVVTVNHVGKQIGRMEGDCKAGPNQVEVQDFPPDAHILVNGVWVEPPEETPVPAEAEADPDEAEASSVVMTALLSCITEKFGGGTISITSQDLITAIRAAKSA